ncbi:MAG: transcription antitermination protein NusB [Bacteroides sp.]|nr:MAG: transcription antitermination protein NusB [Bacteroides sp.]
MLTRRHIRIKVLQILYAYYQNNCENIVFLENYLCQSFKDIYIQYYQLLSLLIEILNIINNNKNIIDQKNIIKLLNNNTHINKQIINFNIKNDKFLILILINDINSSDKYKNYINIDNCVFYVDKSFIKFIINNFFKNSIVLEQNMYEKNMNWDLDKNIIYTMIINTIDNCYKINKCIFNIENLENYYKFSKMLYNDTIKNDNLIESYIDATLINWDIKRISFIDKIIVKMAITEIIKYNNIPYKVSINEYIEISKIFGTPNSNVFVNGIINKIYNKFFNKV